MFRITKFFHPVKILSTFQFVYSNPNRPHNVNQLFDRREIPPPSKSYVDKSRAHSTPRRMSSKKSKYRKQFDEGNIRTSRPFWEPYSSRTQKYLAIGILYLNSIVKNHFY